MATEKFISVPLIWWDCKLETLNHVSSQLKCALYSSLRHSTVHCKSFLTSPFEVCISKQFTSKRFRALTATVLFMITAKKNSNWLDAWSWFVLGIRSPSAEGFLSTDFVGFQLVSGLILISSIRTALGQSECYSHISVIIWLLLL